MLGVTCELMQLYRKTKSAHAKCIACGNLENNPSSLNLNFAKLDAVTVEGHFLCDEKFQGYQGILHGGITCLALDSAMTNCIFLLGIHAMTAEMNVRFIKKIPVGEMIKIRARVTESRRKLHTVKAEIYLGNIVCADALGKFIEVDL
ncbi:PaaI family thioesterase [Acidithiobacillus sp.]|uniref:PaaI family thioesterase n=1 Tax=Acidithiobacillus sp. TaxID=1872118 RepID=UPI0025B93B23|nr:PaaI family thioesterase [Acidithiobacillus sp.]